MELTLLSFCWSVALWYHARCGYREAWVDPWKWETLPIWDRCLAWNRTWMLICAGLLALQIRVHLWQIGLMPTPLR